MDSIADILVGLSTLFTEPDSSMYWPYLASTLCLVMAVYAFTHRQRWSLSGLIHFCLPRHIYRGSGFMRDVAMMFINTLIYSYFMLSYIVSSELITGATWRGLYAVFGEVGSPLQGTAAVAGVSMAALLAVDLGFYISHWLHHRIPLLWEFHKVHHSAETLNPFTTFRRHPVDFFIEGNITGVLTGVAFGLFAWLSNGLVDMATIMGVNAGLFCFLLLGAHLQHSHIWLSYGPVFNRIFISPAMHQIHHSKSPPHLDRNMGNIFSFWDALMGTIYVPKQREQLVLGLVRNEEAHYRNLWRLYMLPFARFFGLLLKKRQGLSQDRVDLPGK